MFTADEPMLDPAEREARAKHSNPSTESYAAMRGKLELTARVHGKRVKWFLDDNGWWHSSTFDYGTIMMLQASGDNYVTLSQDFLKGTAYLWAPLVVEDMLNAGECDPTKPDTDIQSLVVASYSRRMPPGQERETLIDLYDELHKEHGWRRFNIPRAKARLRTLNMFKSFNGGSLPEWPDMPASRDSWRTTTYLPSEWLTLCGAIALVCEIFDLIGKYDELGVINVAADSPLRLKCQGVPGSGIEGRAILSLLMHHVDNFSVLGGLPRMVRMVTPKDRQTEISYSDARDRADLAFCVLLWNLAKSDLPGASSFVTDFMLGNNSRGGAWFSEHKTGACSKSPSSYASGMLDCLSKRWRASLRSVLHESDVFATESDRVLAADLLMSNAVGAPPSDSLRVRWPAQEIRQTALLIADTGVTSRPYLQEKLKVMCDLIIEQK